MKNFIKDNIVFGFSIILIFAIGLLLPNNNPVKSIDYSLIKKHELLNNIKAKKIILTGGSNVLFGYNSEIIQNNLKTPVVNQAIHAGYGLKYIIEDVVPFVNPGDVVILSPEYSHFIDNNYLGKEPLLFSLTAVPKNLKLMSFNQALNIAEFIPKFSLDKAKSFVYNFVKPVTIKKNALEDYRENSINDFGDHYTHWNKTAKNIDIYDFNGAINPKAINFLENISKIIEQKGGELYITYPSLCSSAFNLNKPTITEINIQLHNSKLSILGEPNDYLFNDSYFYDTCYHLNGKGVQNRSIKLSKELKTILK